MSLPDCNHTSPPHSGKLLGNTCCCPNQHMLAQHCQSVTLSQTVIAGCPPQPVARMLFICKFRRADRQSRVSVADNSTFLGSWCLTTTRRKKRPLQRQRGCTFGRRRIPVAILATWQMLLLQDASRLGPAPNLHPAFPSPKTAADPRS